MQRLLRDILSEDVAGIRLDSEREFQRTLDLVTQLSPELAPRVRLHNEPGGIFERHGVATELERALRPKVWLPSGGYVVIDQTEALVAIDVNTGSYVGKEGLEDTILRTNLDAAREIVRQIRLRDLGGIIVVDFIDMLLEENKGKVEETMKEAMALDKTRSQVFEIGPLGLMQVTRKRVSSGLVESFSETCPTCEGRGILVNYGS